jgi:hypothetical protein
MAAIQTIIIIAGNFNACIDVKQARKGIANTLSS